MSQGRWMISKTEQAAKVGASPKPEKDTGFTGRRFVIAGCLLFWCAVVAYFVS